MEELAQLDEQLRIAAGETDMPSTGRNGFQEVALPADHAVLELLNGVQLPTLRALITASLEPLRAAIAAASREDDADRCAAYHVVLGGALQLRAGRANGYRRAELLIEATRSFDSAYGIYAILRRAAVCHDEDIRQNFAPAAPAIRRGAVCRPAGPCMRERDVTLLVTRAVSAPTGANGYLLERAVAWLRLARAGADIQSWNWVSSTNNLACALTLLGNRTPAAAGSAMLSEAARVLREALTVHAAGCRREDRGSTLINLAEALLSMAERETPALRLRKIERALTASSLALMSVVPAHLAWLVRPVRRELE